jgi:hypothetical protein
MSSTAMGTGAGGGGGDKDPPKGDRLPEHAVYLTEVGPHFASASTILQTYRNAMDNNNCHGYTFNGTISSVGDEAFIGTYGEGTQHVRVFLMDKKIAHSGRIDGSNLLHFLKGVGIIRSPLGAVKLDHCDRQFDLPAQLQALKEWVGYDPLKVKRETAHDYVGAMRVGLSMEADEGQTEKVEALDKRLAAFEAQIDGLDIGPLGTTLDALIEAFNAIEGVRKL